MIMQLLRRGQHILLAAVCAVAVVGGPFTQVVGADPGVAEVSSLHKAQARKRALLEGLHACLYSTKAFGSRDWGYMPNIENISQGDWKLDGWQAVGAVASQQGWMYCNDIPAAVKEAFGYANFTELFCKLGGSRPGQRTSEQDCLTMSKEGSAIIERDAVSAGIDRLRREHAKDNLTRDNPVLNYATGMAALLSGGDGGCSFRIIGPYSKLSTDQQKQTSRIKKGRVVATDGSIMEVAYDVGNNFRRQVYLFSETHTRQIGGDTISRYNPYCENVINWVWDSAPHYAATIKKATQEAVDTARNKTINAAIGKLTPILCAPGAPSITDPETPRCADVVVKIVTACAATMPKEGSLGNADPFIQCIQKATTIPSADIKSALDSVTVVTPELPTVEAAGESDGIRPPDCAIPGIGWLLCPTMNFLANAADTAFQLLSKQILEINPAYIGGDARNAWGIMQGIANATFIVFFIAIIYSQITGTGISNYGIKKLLPKLFVVAILVNVSFFICQIAVDLSNILGYSLKTGLSGIASSIGATDSLLQLEAADSYGLAGTGFWASMAGVAAGVTGGYILFIFFGSALVAALAGVLVTTFMLLARHAIVILLVVLSPLAFVAYLLPNTENLFKKWVKVMTAMLLMFPVAGLLFGAGELAHRVIQGASGGSTFIQIMGQLAAVLPLFLIWGLMKKSMDAVGNLGSVTSRLSGGASKFAQDRYKKSRLGMSEDYRKERKEIARRLRMAGSYEGRNPVRKLQAGINKRINSMSKFGRRMAASGVAMANKEDQERVAEASALIRSQAEPGQEITAAEGALTQAISKGDTVRARAAMDIMLATGRGRSTLSNQLQQMENNKALPASMKTAIRGHLVTKDLKGSDNAMMEWALQGGNLTATQRAASTYAALNPVELAGQSMDNLRAGAHAITPEAAAAVLDSEIARDKLDATKRTFFSNAAGAGSQPRRAANPPSGPAPRRAANPSTPSGPSGAGNSQNPGP